MKKTISFYLPSILAIVFTACGPKEVEPPTPTPSVTTYSSVINEDVTWTKDNVYTLAGRVVVPSGVTLTIEAGTVIKANTGDEANACALIIARGGKIMANGTATEPIIFTTSSDLITKSHSNYPGFANLDDSDAG